MAISFGGFSLKNYKEAEGHEGIMMSGKITLDGVPFADFIDDGNGGMMEITRTSPVFDEAAKKAETLLERFSISKLESPLVTIVYTLSEVNAVAKKTRSRFVAVAVVRDTAIKSMEYNMVSCFSARSAEVLQEQDILKMPNVVSYIGLIPPKRGRVMFEVANKGKF